MGAENWEQQTLLTTGWAISLALLLISVLVFEINSWSSCLSLPRTVWQMWVTKPCWNTLFSPQPLRVPCLFSGTAQFHQNTYSLTISTMKDSSFKTDNLHAPPAYTVPRVQHTASLLGFGSEADCVSEIPEFGKRKQQHQECKASLGYMGALPQKGKCWRKTGALNVSSLN